MFRRKKLLLALTLILGLAIGAAGGYLVQAKLKPKPKASTQKVVKVTKSSSPAASNKPNATTTPADPEKIRRVMTFLSANIGPRPEGKAGEKQAASYLLTELEKLGYKVGMEEFVLPSGSSSQNLVTADPGQSSKYTFFVCAHIDSKSGSPGANDNASGVAVAMAVAQALAGMEPRPRRSVAFLFFAAEEQWVKGSEYYLQHQPPALASVRAFINLDGVGRGRRLEALAAKNYPKLWKYFAVANRELVHAAVSPSYFHNRARPRLDAARFMWAGVPTVSFSAYGAPELPYPVYHTSHDRPEILTPQIMVYLGQLIFSAVIQLADSE